MPQDTRRGYCTGLMQLAVLSHSAWDLAQTPQYGLQHSSPTLHVFMPHGVLTGAEAMPQTCCEHTSPGRAQVPQLALQHTSPRGHCVLPHGTGGGCAAEGLAVAVGCAVATPGIALAVAPPGGAAAAFGAVAATGTAETGCGGA